jgi:hypothetical protein
LNFANGLKESGASPQQKELIDALLASCVLSEKRNENEFSLFFFFFFLKKKSVNNNMAAVFLKRGNLDRAKEVCYFHSHSTSSHSLSQCVLCLFGAKTKNTKQVLNRCIALDGKNAKAHFRLAKVYTELKGNLLH